MFWPQPFTPKKHNDIGINLGLSVEDRTEQHLCKIGKPHLLDMHADVQINLRPRPDFYYSWPPPNPAPPPVVGWETCERINFGCLLGDDFLLEWPPA